MNTAEFSHYSAQYIAANGREGSGKMAIPHRSLGSAHRIGCVCCECVCANIWSRWIVLPPKDDTPSPPPPSGRSVHSETAWKPHLKGLPWQYPGTLRPRDLILHWDLPKTYLWSIFFNLLNLLIFDLLSSKGIKGAQLCSKTIYHLWVKCIVVTMWLTWSKCFASTAFNNSDLTTYKHL